MIWRNSALLCETQTEGNPRGRSRAVTDTDEDMDRILMTDDSHVKRSSVCVNRRRHSCDTHVSCVNEHMSYKCVSRWKERPKWHSFRQIRSRCNRNVWRSNDFKG